MKYVLSLDEIAKACSEYVVRMHHPTARSDLRPVAWDARAIITTQKVVGIDTGFPEGVISSVSVEIVGEKNVDKRGA
jgi:hypothetical protein